MERQADGWTLCQFTFSAFYPVVHPPLYDHPFSASHAMQLNKPFILSPPIHLKEEPEMSAGQRPSGRLHAAIPPKRNCPCPDSMEKEPCQPLTMSTDKALDERMS